MAKDIEIINNGEKVEWTSELGYSIWNIAIQNAPYKTGNLRSQIHLQHNGPKIKRIVYNDQSAYYLHFLEEGMGRIKRHKGFISDTTVTAIYMEILSFQTTGISSFNYVPSIKLRTDRARNYEREILRKAGLNVNMRLTANDRAVLSRAQFRKEGSIVGEKFYTRNNEIAKLYQTKNKSGEIISPDKLYYLFGNLKVRDKDE